MSRLAALAMRDLAECLWEEAGELPKGPAKLTLMAMANAHKRAADRIEERGAKMEVPAEYRIGQAGSRKDDR